MSVSFESYILFFISIIFHILLYLMVIKYSSKFRFATYKSPQKIHSGYIPRIGGLFIVSSFLINSLSLNLFGDYNTLNLSILSASIILMLGSLKEDLFLNSSYKLRLILIICSALFFSINEEKLPDIFLNNTNIFFDIIFLKIIFYSFCIVIVINGMNFIDGANGLASFTSLSVLLSLLYIDIFFGNSQFSYVIILLIISLSIFIIFNFPLGLIFLGDTGAYWLGLIISILTIKIFNVYYYLSPWLAIIILIYPSIEIFFSFVRKLINKESPFMPDVKHLHMMLFLKLRKNRSVSNRFSSLVTCILFPLWLLPFAYIFIILNNNQSKILILFFAILHITLYFIFFIIIKKIKN